MKVVWIKKDNNLFLEVMVVNVVLVVLGHPRRTIKWLTFKVELPVLEPMIQFVDVLQSFLSGGKKIDPEQLEAKTAGIIPFPHYFTAVPDDRLGQARGQGARRRLRARRSAGARALRDIPRAGRPAHPRLCQRAAREHARHMGI